MQIIFKSIAADETAARTNELGRYHVMLTADGVDHAFVYKVDLSGGWRRLSWEPSRSFLSDPDVDVLAVASLSDMVVDFHQGKDLNLPREILPLKVGSETAVIKF